jgi:CRP-like cAMP-binding protein
MKEFLKALNLLSTEELNEIELLTYDKTIAKNDFFIKEGQICNEIVFIKSGILRSYYTTTEGNEITNCITFENELMSAYSSFIEQSPTDENIQALKTTQVKVLKKADLLKLYKNSMNWQEVGRLLAEMQYEQLEKRIVSFQKKNAKERYLELLTNHPNYIQYIPLNNLASFLGITTRHLSRLRKEVWL